MHAHPLAVALRLALSGGLMLAAAPLAFAQSQPEAPDAGEAKELEQVVVKGQIVYRDRADTVAPTLVYDLEYFQRFEPRTVGDMLKRVPSVAFLSDVLEYDGARLRGLDPGYTQVLVNGKKVPGAGDDRSFFVDRIPAEMVERIEIVRSPSANRSGDAVAGALNIVLRDAYEFDDAYVRVGASYFNDGEVKPTFAAVGGVDFAGGRLIGGVSHQGRYNPKQKTSLRYQEPDGDFSDREEQEDTRDGTDDSLNLSFNREFEHARLSVDGYYVRTDRTETEHSEEFNDIGLSTREHLLSINDQVEDIDQRNMALSAALKLDMAGGRTTLDASYSRFDDSTENLEVESSFDDEESPPEFDETEGALEITDTDDSEASFSVSHERQVEGIGKLEFGVAWQEKNREVDRRVSEVDTDEEDAPLPPFEDFDLFSSRIRESRIDPYVMLSGENGALAWEGGLRVETTRVDIALEDVVQDNDYEAVLPSLHLRWALSDSDRLSLSLARTVRRPNFDMVLPLLLEGEFGDNDFVGNPQLDPEQANGIDLGFEHRLGKRGVFGVNVFYREVSDLIEMVNTGAPSAGAIEDYEDDVEEFLDENPGADESDPDYPEFDPDSFVFTAQNVGDGEVYGVEFDLSTPLTALGLPDTGVFFNYSWLDSNVEDAIGERRFNDQAHYVLNVGFMHDVVAWDLSFGASYRRQGGAFGRVLAEEVHTSYGADLEAFVEKRFGEHWTLRLAGSNLLDASKDEEFHKFDTLEDQLDRDYDEFETEHEVSGPVYQLVLRYAF